MRTPWTPVLALTLLASMLQFALWWAVNRPLRLPDFSGQIAGIAYSGYREGQSPLTGVRPDASQVAEDVDLIAGRYGKLRSYGSREYPELAQLARERGLRYWAGVWLDRDDDANAREFSALQQLLATGERPEMLIVGNEALHRNDLTVSELAQWLSRARRASGLPVTTAEPWNVWLEHPELAMHVDVVTVHLLPFWEGVSIDGALALALRRYDEVLAKFPGRRVVVGEVGWPSRGGRFGDAVATPANQARFLREWLQAASARGIDYFLIEAFDQPWKRAAEGHPGAYWGLYDVERKPKFALQGPVSPDPSWPVKALAVVLLAGLPLILVLRRLGGLRLPGLIGVALAIQGVAGLAVLLAAHPLSLYLDPVERVASWLLLPAQLLLLLPLLAASFELLEVGFRRAWRHRVGVRPASGKPPRVSIHLPTHAEPPDLVIQTLDSLARLDYPDFEVLVIDNNTTDPKLWQPVAAHAERLGPRFRFVHVENWPGYKAGALNLALRRSDPEADIVAVIDADYVVEANWLRDLTGHFEDPEVGFVQAPQAHRPDRHDTFERLIHWEYEGFFRIGMHQRNERNALIQHGTMCLIRRSALEAVGGWSEWCLCEDSELGLRLQRAGFRGLYVDHPYGRGILPCDYRGFTSQRHRWAFGAMQILKQHAGALFRRGRLSLGQRLHYLFGWSNWLADALHLPFTLASVAWTVGMIVDPWTFPLPLTVLLVPMVLFCVIKLGLGVYAYRGLMRVGWRETWSAALASMALSHAVAHGVWAGLLHRREQPFRRTPKRPQPRGLAGALADAREPLVLALGLLFASFAFLATSPDLGVDRLIWCLLLLTQALPYLASVALSLISMQAATPSTAAAPVLDEAEAMPNG